MPTRTTTAAVKPTGPTTHGLLRVGVATILACLGGVARAGTDPGALPDAASILDRYVEVTGGKAAYERIHNRVARGTHVFRDVGLKGTQTTYFAAPNKRYSELEVEELGKVWQGTDGDVVWYLSDGTGAMVEEGEARAAGLREAAFDMPVHWRKYYDKAETVAVETLDGKRCVKVLLTPAEGEPETRYYDVSSGLLIKVGKTRLSSRMPPMPVTVVFSNYREVDGLLLPFKFTQITEQCGSERAIDFTTDSIEHNVTLAPDRFDPPEEVKAVAILSRGAAIIKDLTGHGSTARQAPCGKTKPAASEATKSKPCGGGS